MMVILIVVMKMIETMMIEAPQGEGRDGKQLELVGSWKRPPEK